MDSYDPWKAVSKLKNDYGYFGIIVLESYNEIDPYNCFYGHETNPDEYATNVHRFFDNLINQGMSIIESVRRSFHESDLQNMIGDEQEITEVISRVANLITEVHSSVER